MRAFLLLLQLLEDEDRAVRIAAAKTAGQASIAFGSEDCSSAAVPYVQQKTFALMARHFGCRLEFVQQLLAWILRWANCLGRRLSTCFDTQTRMQVMRIDFKSGSIP